MDTTGLKITAWRKSSRSGGGNACVEVAMSAGIAALRDSKNPDAGHLVIGRPEWTALLAALKSNRVG